jgi:DNA-directed RNA polymerase subunit beta
MPDLLSPGLPSVAAVPPMREFGDAAATRQNLFDNVLDAAKTIQPVKNQQYSLELADVHYYGPDKFSKRDEKQALLNRTSLARQLRGTWVLKDNQGGVVGAKKTTLANVPYLTDRGTFVFRGNTYTLSHQFRLRPGVYTRIKASGEPEAHVNVAKGLGHSIMLEPETGVFRMKVGQAQLPLYSVLKTLGVDDKQMQEAWGTDLYAANVQKQDPQVIQKLYARLVNGKDSDPASMRDAVIESFNNMELDPRVTKRTLRKAYDRVSPDVLMDATRRVLAVSRQNEDADDRDALAFQKVYGPEDLFAERIKKAGTIARQILWKATARRGVDRIPVRAYQSAVDDLMINSGLASPLEEVNAGEVFDQQTRITRLGEGGIPSRDAVPAESRNVQPTQYGYIDPIRTPESGSAGIDLRVAAGARKGKDGEIYTQIRKLDGTSQWANPDQLLDEVVAFAGEMKSSKPYAAVIKNGKLAVVPKDEVTAEVADNERTFSPLANLVPLKSMVKGQRMAMGSRMLTQALPLVDGEAPYVQTATADNRNESYEERYGSKFGAVRYDGTEAAVVKKVDADEIVLSTPQGDKTIELYNQLPANRKTFTHQAATVLPGQVVKPGQLLARSNYTDANGNVAIGKNTRVAYIPYYGFNVDDAIVVSESYAKRMTSEHAYQNTVDWTPDHYRGKNAFRSLFPEKYEQKVYANFEPNGIIKPGTKVEFGDPLLLLAAKQTPDKKRLHTGRRSLYEDASITWDHHYPGEVVDVIENDKGATVVVRAQAPMQLADKLSNLYGGKGVIGKVVPDEQMPQDGQGRPFEVLLNPLGVVSRANPAQIIAAVLGKVSEKTGKPYKIKDFENTEQLIDFARNELKKNGLSDTETIYDPVSGKKIKNVLTGNAWLMKLHHMSADKNQGRGIGRYTAEQTPARGGEEGGKAKRLGMLEVNSLLSHGATGFLKGTKLYRSQANPEYWMQYMSGYSPQVTKVPFVYDKMVNSLKAAGINVIEDGPRTHIMAMTNADVDKLTEGREITNAETVDWKNMAPVRGGLFDDTIFAGHRGSKWGALRLTEPLVNPVMEEPVRRVLGLTKNKFREVIAGTAELNGETGSKAIGNALQKIDLDAAIATAMADVNSGRKTRRDDAIKKLGFLTSAKRLGIHPKDWMLAKVPILPPIFRPVSTIGDTGQIPLIADANSLYKELFDANYIYGELAKQVDSKDLGQERLQVYDAFKAVVGLGDPLGAKSQERGVTGILAQVFGNSPKFGSLQYRLLSGNVDTVGRSVIAPDPNLDMDHVGLPETHAWNIYQPHIVRAMVRRGYSRGAALEHIKNQTQAARAFLLDELEKRPVVISRAPTWHRYGILSAWPKLVKGDAMRLSPIVAGGFGADFDGDQMNFHVPASEDEVKDAVEKMLPSRNLISTADFKAHYTPHQDYLGGLFEATSKIGKQKEHVFVTVKDAIAAFRRGDVDIETPINILNKDKQ